MATVTCARAIITGDPYVDWSAKWGGRGQWRAAWIGHPGVAESDVAVTAFRRTISLEQPLTARIHVTADERYELFIDGERIARGSERGDPRNWFYESYDVTMPPGAHTIVARTWHLGHAGVAPCAQMSLRPGFLLAADGDDAHTLLSTGVAPWESAKLGGYHFSWGYPTELPFTGARVRMCGAEIAWGVETGSAGEWVAATTICQGINASMMEEQPDNVWLLRPARLPAMYCAFVKAGMCRHVEAVTGDATETLAVTGANHLPAEGGAWDSLTKGAAPLTILPRTMRRVILDLENYYCGYVELTVSGGAGSRVRVRWAESPYDLVLANAGGYTVPPKGNRGEIEGKFFRGFADTFEPDGGTGRVFRPLWWSAGRYLEVFVATGADALIVNGLRIEETHFPYEWRGTFEASDERLSSIIPMCKRTLEMCSHETYMDCPYYEQLMYVGDTRIEVLQTYVMCGDDRLPRKALFMFDASRRLSGLTQSRFPTRVTQIIPTFSLWWVAMVHDYLMWRGDVDFVKERMPGVRAVLEAFRRYVNADGLVEAPSGWNFVDWVPGWDRGCPPDGDRGVSASINLQTAMVLRLAAEIEEFLGEAELAGRNRSLAGTIVRSVLAKFWDEKRGIFADDLDHKHFSEHAQCLAILGGAVAGQQRERVVAGLLSAPDLYRATIYFSHYLFETFRATGSAGKLFKRLEFWFDLRTLGLTTTIETPEPSRSDCHAWGAHPIFHYFSSILGIRPAAPGFAKVRVEPLLGPLQWAKGSMPHPGGAIGVDLAVREGRLAGIIELPRGIGGELVVAGRTVALHEGRQEVAAG